MKTQSPNVQQMTKKVSVEFLEEGAELLEISVSWSGVVTQIISEVDGKGH